MKKTIDQLMKDAQDAIANANLYDTRTQKQLFASLTQEERIACRKEIARNYGGIHSNIWQEEIIQKHLDKALVKVSDMKAIEMLVKTVAEAEKVMAKWGMEMPEVSITLNGCNTLRKDSATMSALDFWYRRNDETDEMVVSRCIDQFKALAWFESSKVLDWCNVHNVKHSMTCGKGYEKWLKEA